MEHVKPVKLTAATAVRLSQRIHAPEDMRPCRDRGRSSSIGCAAVRPNVEGMLRFDGRVIGIRAPAAPLEGSTGLRRHPTY